MWLEYTDVEREKQKYYKIKIVDKIEIEDP
jgi:hypothetical protein